MCLAKYKFSLQETNRIKLFPVYERNIYELYANLLNNLNKISSVVNFFFEKSTPNCCILRNFAMCNLSLVKRQVKESTNP